jgi:hypothetical protein
MSVKMGTKPTQYEIERMEALLEPPKGDDLLDEDVVFRSKGRGFRVVHIGQRRWSEMGMQQVSAGITYEFSPGGDVEDPQAGAFRTRDRRAVEYLRSLDSYGRDFYEVGNEPGRVPSSESTIEKIMSLALELDDAGLEELQETEQEGYQRQDVLVAVSKAREKVQGMLQQGAPAA